MARPRRWEALGVSLTLITLSGSLWAQEGKLSPLFLDATGAVTQQQLNLTDICQTAHANAGTMVNELVVTFEQPLDSGESIEVAGLDMSERDPDGSFAVFKVVPSTTGGSIVSLEQLNALIGRDDVLHVEPNCSYQIRKPIDKVVGELGLALREAIRRGQPTFDMSNRCPPLDQPVGSQAIIIHTLSSAKMNSYRLPGFRTRKVEVPPTSLPVEKIIAFTARPSGAENISVAGLLDIVGQPDVVVARWICGPDQNAMFSNYQMMLTETIPNFCSQSATCPVPLAPNDPFFQNHQQWPLESIRAFVPWSTGLFCASTPVAVIDTGVELNHPDLKDNLWHNPIEVANGIDDDANGCIDDLNGCTFGPSCNPAVTACSPPTDNVTRHGSGVINVLAGRGHNDTAGVGVVPFARIVPIKVEAGSSGTVSPYILARAINYARKLDVKVINISYELTVSSFVVQWIIWLASDKLIVASAGDIDSLGYPAISPNPNILSVTGIIRHTCNANNVDPDDPADPVKIDLAAPVANICTLCPGGGYCDMYGTSYSAPLVAGGAALVWHFYPELTPVQTKNLLMTKSRQYGTDLQGQSVTEGVLDLSFLQPAYTAGFLTHCAHMVP